MVFEDINKITGIIDHTLLKPEACSKDIEKICDEALNFNFNSVCVYPWWVSKAKDILRHSNVKVCTVIGFPHGMTGIKLQESINACLQGADELDVMFAIGAFKSKFYTDVKNDIKKITDLDCIVKIIIETGLLTNDEIVQACKLCIETEADFIKTCTGFSGGKADVEIIKLINETAGDDIKIKASGGIDTLEKLTSMVEAGADRIGTSNSISIVKEFQAG